jgi:hypothetical protein
MVMQMMMVEILVKIGGVQAWSRRRLERKIKKQIGNLSGRASS